MLRTPTPSPSTFGTAGTINNDGMARSGISYVLDRDRDGDSDSARGHGGNEFLPRLVRVQCSFPKCPTMTAPGKVFCPEHHQSIADPLAAVRAATANSISVPISTSSQQPHRSSSSSSAERQPPLPVPAPVSAASKNKLLAENDKDWSITERNSTGPTTSHPGPPSLKQQHQQDQHHDDAVSLPPPLATGKPTPSPPEAASHPSASPYFAGPHRPSSRAGGEPARKRARLTVSSDTSPEFQPPHAGSNARNHVPMPGAMAKKEPYRRRSSLKMSNRLFKGPVRKMAPPSATLSSFSNNSENNFRSPAPLSAPSPEQELYWNGVSIVTGKRSTEQYVPLSNGLKSSQEAVRRQPMAEMTVSAREATSRPAAPLLYTLPNGHAVRGEATAPEYRRSFEVLPGNGEVRIEKTDPPRPGEHLRQLKAKVLEAQISFQRARQPSRPQPSSRRTVNETLFDSLVYGQEGAAMPPPQVQLPSPAASIEVNRRSQPLPADEPFYACIDPRVHWPQEHSSAWLESKQEEITSRGGRKANFGKAAQRLHQQRLHSEPVPLEEAIPEKIASDPGWLRVWKRLHGVKGDTPDAAPVTAGMGNGKGARKQGLGKRQGSSSSNGNGVSNGNRNGHGPGNGYGNGCPAATGLNGV